MIRRSSLFLLVLVLLTSIAVICTAQPIPGDNSGSANNMMGQTDIQSGQSELVSVSQDGGYDGNGASAQPAYKSSKLRCYIWSDNDYYNTGDMINVYYQINKPCYVKIVNNYPGGATTVINTWKNAAGTYSIPGKAKEPFGDRTFTLKAWTNTRPQQVCRSSCTYKVGSGGVFAPGPASDGSVNEPSNGPVDQPSNGPVDQPSNGPVDEPSNGPVDEPSNGPVDQPSNGPVDQPSDGSVNEPSD